MIPVLHEPRQSRLQAWYQRHHVKLTVLLCLLALLTWARERNVLGSQDADYNRQAKEFSR